MKEKEAVSKHQVVQGLQSTYKRNGTILNVATGVVDSKITNSKTREDFQSFIEGCSRRHPNITFHFTPTSASWLNQVEIWFGILSRKSLKNASFTSTKELSKAIMDFTERIS